MRGYDQIRAWFLARPRALLWLRRGNQYLPWITGASYMCLLAIRFLAVFWTQKSMFERGGLRALCASIAVPAIIYICGSLLRTALNYPRPYQTSGFVPLVEKSTIGKSFPSRHALSASVLASVWWAFSPIVGVAMLCCAVLIAVLRVLAGVHFVRDVVAGLLFGGVLGAIGMWVAFAL